jgi:hypothetical protein
MMAFFSRLENSAFSMWLLGSDSIWAFPTVLALHALGVMLLAGTSMAIGLRLLGIAPAIPLSSLRPLFRIIWAGFWINLVTGVMLFVADATRKGTMPLFYVKLGVVGVGVVVVMRIRREVFGDGRPETGAGASDRTLALASLVCWIAAIAAGRWLAYVD